MGQAEQLIRYQVGGSLASHAPSYIWRQADTDLYDALMQGELCYVLNARQMGKSSLLVQTKHRLQQAGYRCSVIDITNIGSETITPLQWYTGLIHDLFRGFKLRRQISLSKWKSGEGEFSLLQQLSHFMGDVLLQQFPDEKLVIFIDEIDSILSLPFAVDDLFALIRYCYNQRALNPDYERLNFALFGVATPSDLIRDRNRTPFNIGRPIDLTGFTLDEARPLEQGLTLDKGNSKAILKSVLAWTGGQPFLTQKLCQMIVEQAQQTASGKLMILPGNEAYWVDSLVRDQLLKNWESKDEPEHLRTIRNRILNNPEKSGRLLGIYQQVLQAALGEKGQGKGEKVNISPAPCPLPPIALSGMATLAPITTDDSPEQTNLLLSGLVVKEGRCLRVKNSIYAKVFNAEWVAQQLSQLRPYSQLLETWVAAGKSDESRLLRGQALQDAQQWAQGKQLSDLDYQYLAASVECDRKATQQAMTAERLQAQLQQERKTAKLQRRFLGAVSAALLTAIGFGTFTLWQSRQIRLSEIKALVAAAEGSFDSHRQLEAMHQAIQAEKKRQGLIRPPQQLTQQIKTVLHRLVDGTNTINRLDVEASVRALDIDPTGELLAVVTVEGNLSFWHSDGRRAEVAVVPQEQVSDVTFSPDGSLIAVALGNQTIQLWQLDGTLINTLTGLPENLRHLQFSPDGQHLLVNSRERRASLLSLDGTVLNELNNANPIVFSPTGDFIAAASLSGPLGQKTAQTNVASPRQVKPIPADAAARHQPSPMPPISPTRSKPNTLVLDARGQPIEAFHAGFSPIFALAVSPDGEYIALARIDGNVELWTPTGQLAKTFYGHRTKVHAIAFSPDGQWVATAGSDKTVKLWQTDGSLLKTFSGHRAAIRHLKFSPDGQWLASAADDGTLRLWQPQQPLQENLAAHTDTIVGLAFTPDNQQLLSFSVDQWMKVWQRNQANTFEASPITSQITQLAHFGLAVSPDRQTIAKFLPGERVELIETDGTVLQTLKSGRLHDAAFSPDGQRLVAGARDRTVKIWQRQKNGLFASRPSRVLTGHRAKVTSVAISPDGTLIATGSADKTISLWRNHQRVATLTGHQAEVKNLAFSPDSQWLASGSADNTVKLWQADGILLNTLTGHGAAITSLAFSPDGKLLASASVDSTVKVWQPDQPDPLLRTLTGHQGHLASVVFSPDGKLIASAGVDRRITLWHIDKILQVNELDYACQWLDDYLQHHPQVNGADRHLCRSQ
ncbi:MAG: AAA-like domain-containing protein [Cyanobacteria bacterium J06635_1]